MEGLLEPPEASHWQMELLVHMSSTPVLEKEGSPFPADEVSHQTESISVQQFRDVDMSNGTETQTERRFSPLMAASPVVNGVQGMTETQSYAVTVVGKDAASSGECFTVSNDEVLVSDTVRTLWK
ncbi:hypothetical protein V6N13_018580 [Hibiscus sabdariffa]